MNLIFLRSLIKTEKKENRYNSEKVGKRGKRGRGFYLRKASIETCNCSFANCI